MLAARPLTKVAQHVWFDVNREDLAVRNASGDSDGEITSASADVGDFIGWSQMQRIQDFVRLLHGVALRIVELFGPFFGIAKGVMTLHSWPTAYGVIIRMLLLHWSRRLRGRGAHQTGRKANGEDRGYRSNHGATRRSRICIIFRAVSGSAAIQAGSSPGTGS